MSKYYEKTKAANARQLPLFILYFNLRMNKKVTIVRGIQVVYKYSLIYGYEHWIV